LLHVLNVLSVCEAGSYFKLVADYIALPAMFDITTAVSVNECCLKCDRVNNCITVGYNAQRKECLLSETTTLTHGRVQTMETTKFQVFQGMSVVLPYGAL